jgi:hypothetical protein
MTDAPIRFIFPDKFQDKIRTGANAGKEKQASTINLYRSHMHQIAAATGITTVEELIKKHLKVTQAIKKLAAQKEGESDLKHRSRARVFYSAIFTFLPEEYSQSPNPFFRAYQKWKEAYTPEKN